MKKKNSSEIAQICDKPSQSYKDFLIKAFERQSETLSSELKKFYSSRSYRWFYNFSSTILPHGSLRRRVAKFFFNLLKRFKASIEYFYYLLKKQSGNLFLNPNGIDIGEGSEKNFFKKNGAKTILVIDRYVPRHDKDAGSRSTYSYITILSELGFDVKFMGADFLKGDKYGDALEKRGIDVLYGEYYNRCWKEWFLKNHQDIDFIFLNRPNVTEIFIDFMKSVSKAKVIYNVVDLHFLRILGEYDILHEKNLLKKAAAFKDLELDLIKKADVALTFSCYEKEVINKELGLDKAKWIPILFFNEYKEPSDIKAKRDIMFIGSFTHFPNEDGILWFLSEIWGDLSSRLPDCRLFIVGSEPTESLKMLSSGKIVVTGYVSDNELTEYYKYCRVAIIPLRCGAGVKGKVIEAMYNRVGIVSTSVGLEGLENISNYMAPADTAEKFLNDVLTLYSDDYALKNNIDRTGKYIEKYFSGKRLSATIENIFK